MGAALSHAPLPSADLAVCVTADREAGDAAGKRVIALAGTGVPPLSHLGGRACVAPTGRA